MTPLTLVWEAHPEVHGADGVVAEWGGHVYIASYLAPVGLWLCSMDGEEFTAHFTRTEALAAATRHAATGRWEP